MGGIELKGVEGDLVSSVHLQEFSGPHAVLTVRSRGKSVGTLIVAREDCVKMAARLFGPQAHEHTEAGSILDRCVSLVQSLAKSGYPEHRDQVDTFIDEASLIAHDAGWK